MPENNRGLKADLALALATGRCTVARWAKEQNVSRRTAYRWAAEPGVKAAVESVRRKLLDRAVGRLARAVTKAVDEIVKLATKGQSEAVRLQAARAVYGDMMAIMDHAEIKSELQEIKKRLDAQEARRAKRKP